MVVVVKLMKDKRESELFCFLKKTQFIFVPRIFLKETENSKR